MLESVCSGVASPVAVDGSGGEIVTSGSTTEYCGTGRYVFALGLGDINVVHPKVSLRMILIQFLPGSHLVTISLHLVDNFEQTRPLPLPIFSLSLSGHVVTFALTGSSPLSR